MDAKEIVIVTVFVSIAAYSLLAAPLTEFYNSTQAFIENLKSIFYSNIYQIALISLVSFLIIKFVYSKISKKIYLTKRKRERIAYEKERIERFLETNFRRMNLKAIELRVNSFQKAKRNFLEDSMKDYHVRIGTKFLDLEKALVEAKHKDEVEKIKSEKYGLRRDIERLRREKLKIENFKEFKRQRILEKLNIYEKSVFKINNLKKEEIKILKEEKYKQINEYCVFDQKIITVLMKKTMNHSYRHSFLVWSVRKLLENYHEITNIREHDTREADLTFNVNSKKYAIEVETGSILSKPDQLERKIGFLKRKYKKRWIILVSNRDSLKHYRKHGWCTQRKDMRENLEKLLQI